MRVDSQQRHGQPRPSLRERGEHCGLALPPHAHALRPARGDVSHHQAVQVEAGGRGPTAAATRSAEIRNEHTLGSEGWQARGKEVLTTLDNLMLDVGCDSPPLW